MTLDPLHRHLGHRQVMLIVGQFAPSESRAKAAEAEALQNVRYCGFHRVTAELLERVQPSVIISSLMGPQFDAVDLALRLSMLGYGGPYRVLGTSVSDARMVRDEIRKVAPWLDFDLIEQPPET
ncbi:hypothetical protein [uncultured Limimaricola sp.]|uniref:hypothetical protein n=1 Tax=uncultured Limimaricola sp. TaxID=2211667 RepID=UPI0030F86628